MNLTPGQLASQLPRRVGLVTKFAGFFVWNAFTQKNPVLSGRSRGAWNMAINHTDLSVPPEGATIPFPQLPRIGEVFAGDEIRVSNNVDYIRFLRDGSSKQAPSGWIDNSIEEMREAVSGAAEVIRADAERGAR